MRETGADVGLGFDGDGDRCGVVDNEGEEIFADKIGVMLARDLSTLHPGATFVVDVKSTGLFATDPELKAHGVKTDYWKTGHSYIKRRVNELSALAGFEKSGHFFFNTPIGRGYDDGLLTAIAVVEMLDRNPGQVDGRPLPRPAEDLGLADHGAEMRRRDESIDVVDRVVQRFTSMQAEGRDGRRPADPRPRHRQRRAGRDRGRHLGPRARLVQQARARGRGREPGVGSAACARCSGAVDEVLRENPEVGAYNQTI